MVCTLAICWEEALLIPRLYSCDLAKSSLLLSQKIVCESKPSYEQQQQKKMLGTSLTYVKNKTHRAL